MYRSLRAPASSVAILYPGRSSLLCASHTIYLLDLETKKDPLSFTASSNPVHTMLTPNLQNAPPSTFLTASDSERTINVFNVTTSRLAGTLVPEADTICLALSPVVQNLEKNQPNGSLPDAMKTSEQTLAAVNKEGMIEIFPSPFDFVKAPVAQDSESIKARRKSMTRKAIASIKITRPDKSSTIVPISDVSFEGSDIVMAWTEGGVNVLFDRIKWQDESTGKLVLQGTNEVVKAKIGAGVGGVIMNGVKDMGKTHVDDSHTVVANGGDVQMGTDPASAIDVSSAEDESESSEEEAGEEDEPPQAEPVSQLTSQEDEDIEMQDVEDQNAVVAKDQDEAEEAQQETEPTFGEMIRAKAQEAIDVQASFPPQNQQVIATTDERNLQLPSGLSLGTVLTQSLRTNDVNLLESCFHVRDLQTVRATIERIDSSLATTLLQKLAERLHSRPGRAGSLMVWIQWTLVAHGGYLASQPEVMKKLTSLHRVVAERANSLQSLLSLKGKLDMLEAQMNLRKSMQARSRAANALDEDDEEGVIYVEGQEETDSDDGPENAMQLSQTISKDAIKTAAADRDAEVDDSEGVDDEDEMPTTTNGVVADSEDEGSESDDEGLIDDEAVSTDEDSDDEVSADEVNHNDVSSIGSEASSEPEDVPPAKRLAKTGLANGLGKKSR